MKIIPLLSLALLLSLAGIVIAEDRQDNAPLSLEKVIASSASIKPENADLVIKGRIGQPNPALFSLELLKTFPPTSFQLKNHWTGAKEKYTGVAFIELLRFLGLDNSAQTVDVIAMNDYRIKIKIDDLKAYDYLLSYALNDTDYAQLEPAENKGPLAIAINFDKHPELDRDIYKHQLVWFVKTLIVE